MISRRCAIVLALLVATGCVDEVPVVEIATTATTVVTLSVPHDYARDEVSRFRWELVTAPENAVTGAPHGDASTASFVPNRRGVYLVDRWAESELSERLTYHIVVTVRGAAPQATVGGDRDVTVGTTAMLDATSSLSPERRQLLYRWRLAMRPANSQTMLGAVDGAQLAVIPDVAGDYAVELMVFDGELWSALPATFAFQARAP